MMDEWEIEKQYNSTNPIISHIKWQRLKNCVKMAELKKYETVLDFGCYKQKLWRMLPANVKYTGYDIEKEYTDIKDYTALTGVDTVFALSVFEHLTEIELEKVIKDFKKIGVKKLIVELPREDSPVNKFINYSMGWGIQSVLNHKITWQTAIKIIDTEFKCTNYKNYYWLNWHIKFEKR